jgi:hypothetical protein
MDLCRALQLVRSGLPSGTKSILLYHDGEINTAKLIPPQYSARWLAIYSNLACIDDRVIFGRHVTRLPLLRLVSVFCLNRTGCQAPEQNCFYSLLLLEQLQIGPE